VPHRVGQAIATRAVGRSLRKMLCLDDFERAAKAKLPRAIFGYLAGAVETGASLADNRAAFAEYGFVPRVLSDLSGRSQRTTLFGRSYAAPFGLGPMGISAMFAYRGDIVLARAAAAMNVPAIMSASSLIRMEDVVQAAPDTWFQAYLPGDVPRITALVERAARAGFRTLVTTLDCQVAGNRENNIRNGFSMPLRPSIQLAWDGISHPHWLFGTFLRTLARHGMPHFENNLATRGAPILSPDVVRDFTDRGDLDWSHIELVRRLWKGPLVIKGVLAVDDACQARDAGADGIIISNHGGRQLDGSVSALRMLPAVANACSDIVVMMDGGIRRGTDVLKALALGARFVFAARPFGFAGAVGGEAGVCRGIELLSDEIHRDMGLLGISSLDQLDAGWLMRLAPPSVAS
jgi:L-lactate dehydrogenase (cytochrome)